MATFSRELGIDLGTMFIRIVEGGEVVLQEPTIVAVDINEQKIVAVGEEALGMVGRVSEDTIEVTRPLQNGVVAYYELTERLLDHLVRKIGGSVRLFKPKHHDQPSHMASQVWKASRRSRSGPAGW